MSTPEIAQRRFTGLNALRAMGALMVLCTHAAFDTGKIYDGWTGAVFARMDFGVAIFFVLSGFLLSRPFLLRAAQFRASPSVPHYLWKRFLRVMPLYWLTLAAVLAFEPANEGVISPSSWLDNVFLLQLYRPGLLPFGFSQMWSLATEVAFYLLLPVLMALLLARPRRFSERRILVALAIVSVLGVAWQSIAAPVPGSEGHFAQWLPGYLPWFCAGIAFATTSVGDTLRPRRHLLTRLADDPAGCWLAALLVFGLACTPLAGPRDLVSPTGWEAGAKAVLYGLSAALFLLPLVFGHENHGRIRVGCAHPVPFFLGEISYGIFCVHVVVMRSVFRSLELDVFHGHFLQVVAVTAAISIAVASLAHYAVERPLLALKGSGPLGREASAARTSEPTSVH